MNIGVVIARFQIDDLHEGHKALLNHVLTENNKLVVLLGCCSTKVTTKNPLDFKSRRLMIWSHFPTADVFPVFDNRSNHLWSVAIDVLLNSLYKDDTVTLYGSRDSFIPYYSGTKPVKEYKQEFVLAATERREEISKLDPMSSKAFRSGVIYAAYNRYPICYPTVDVAITNQEKTKVLLGRKKNEALFRFVGGFVDPTDANFEAAATREVIEETGLEVGPMTYIGSKSIEDWRYKGIADNITTTLFTCEVLFGTPIAQDDIAEVKWFDLDKIKPEELMAEHVSLFEMFVTHLSK